MVWSGKTALRRWLTVKAESDRQVPTPRERRSYLNGLWTGWRPGTEAEWGSTQSKGKRSRCFSLPVGPAAQVLEEKRDRMIHWSHHLCSAPSFSRLRRTAIGWRHRESRLGGVKEGRPVWPLSTGSAAPWLEFCLLGLSLTLTSGLANGKLSTGKRMSSKLFAQVVSTTEQRGCWLTSETSLQMSSICLAELKELPQHQPARCLAPGPHVDRWEMTNRKPIFQGCSPLRWIGHASFFIRDDRSASGYKTAHSEAAVHPLEVTYPPWLTNPFISDGAVPMPFKEPGRCTLHKQIRSQPLPNASLYFI